MSIKVVCEKGTELDKSYFVATDKAGGRKVVRASRILSPKLHTLANEDIDDDISNWMSNNFDITDYNVDDAIESWADNNLDEKISEAINNLTFNVTLS